MAIAAWSKPWPRPDRGAGDGIHSAHFPRAIRCALSSKPTSQGIAPCWRRYLYGRVFPMMMTAAGTAAAAVFIMGVGVAGLAIATARRLGAVAPGHENKSPRSAASSSWSRMKSSAGRNRRRLCKADERRISGQAGQLVTSHIAKQDIVITTALIPGRAAPTLVTGRRPEHAPWLGHHRSRRRKAAIARSQARRAGRGERRGDHGFTNLPARLAADASSLR